MCAKRNREEEEEEEREQQQHEVSERDFSDWQLQASSSGEEEMQQPEVSKLNFSDWQLQASSSGEEEAQELQHEEGPQEYEWGMSPHSPVPSIGRSLLTGIRLRREAGRDSQSQEID